MVYTMRLTTIQQRPTPPPPPPPTTVIYDFVKLILSNTTIKTLVNDLIEKLQAKRCFGNTGRFSKINYIFEILKGIINESRTGNFVSTVAKSLGYVNDADIFNRINIKDTFFCNMKSEDAYKHANDLERIILNICQQIITISKIQSDPFGKVKNILNPYFDPTDNAEISDLFTIVNKIIDNQINNMCKENNNNNREFVECDKKKMEEILEKYWDNDQTLKYKNLWKLFNINERDQLKDFFYIIYNKKNNFEEQLNGVLGYIKC